VGVGSGRRGVGTDELDVVGVLRGCEDREVTAGRRGGGHVVVVEAISYDNVLLPVKPSPCVHSPPPPALCPPPGNLTVTVAGVRSVTSVPYTYLQLASPPVVDLVFPLHGPIGGAEPLSLTGSQFGGDATVLLLQLDPVTQAVVGDRLECMWRDVPGMYCTSTEIRWVEGPPRDLSPGSPPSPFRRLRRPTLHAASTVRVWPSKKVSHESLFPRGEGFERLAGIVNTHTCKRPDHGRLMPLIPPPPPSL
jgi:hypothetical protein